MTIAPDSQPPPAEEPIIDRTPITASVFELARRVRTDLLRRSGIDWQDDRATAGGEIDEPATIASWVVLGRIAQERGKLRVARMASVGADHVLWMSCHYGKFKPKPELADTMPIGWQQHFVPIIRTKGEYDTYLRPGDPYIAVHGIDLQLRRRKLVA